MIAIEKPKNPMKINCVWWNGFNKDFYSFDELMECKHE